MTGKVPFHSNVPSLTRAETDLVLGIGSRGDIRRVERSRSVLEHLEILVSGAAVQLLFDLTMIAAAVAAQPNHWVVRCKPLGPMTTILVPQY